uniref:Receptor-like serine/threonine-protein kinase n=2 Tax=Setaria viridis TaxID=4556 RepID=A0A4U6U0L8_SETVI|nr:hypothetical protein SEVIR_7G264300v2 [Setaria viridis]
MLGSAASSEDKMSRAGRGRSCGKLHPILVWREGGSEAPGLWREEITTTEESICIHILIYLKSPTDRQRQVATTCLSRLRSRRAEDMEANWSHLLNLLLVLLSPIAFAAGFADTLGKAGNITGDETLVSANGTFTMGFFFLGPSTNKKYYLGIWFSVSSSDAICWVANSERPLSDKTGALVLSDTGSLLLRDGSGQVAWSSNSTIASSSSVEAQLLETGNLVVRDQGSGNVLLWQSFDHPSNTMLSGMKVGKNLWSGAEWHLTSWRSADDPSPGPYRQVLDTSGLPDFVLLDGNATIYRCGPWNGRSFSGVTEALGNTYTDLLTLGVTISPGEISYSYTSKPGAALTRLVVTDDGKVNRVVWDKSSRGWTHQPIFQGPRDPCDDYGKCGSFGLCDVSSVLSFCDCLRGFSPASPSAWSRDTSGCRRNVKLQCSSNGVTTDGFVLVKGVKLPDTHNASVDMGISMKECRSRCRANCSCLAYAAADIRGGGVPSGCVMWTDNIVDLRYVNHGQDLYLRLAKSELDKDFPLAAVVAPVAFVGAALALFLLIWWRTKTKRNASDGPWSPTMGDLSFDLPTVKMATGDFCQSHVIGEGGFAVVYKGELPDGRTVAVKRLKQSALTDKGRSDFAREVDVMANVRHGNLLRLLAYCNEGGERILIYAFMPNKSLDLYIFGEPSDRARLNWRQRLDIIHGVAHGVAYLHQGSEESVVHRDLKPSNILLDDNWKPKIADFNTAKLFIKDQPDQSDPTIVVSPGYASPEYLQGEMTLKCDVYSFGVILLETLSGQRNSPTKGVISNAREFWQQDRAMALLDPMVPLPLSTPDSEMRSELERYVKIGLLCVQEAPENRPDMSAVVAMLTTRNSDINLLPRAALQNVAAATCT